MDKFAIHEALDRCYIIQKMIDDNLCNHPVIIGRPDLLEMVEKAQELLGEVYQEIGNIE